MSVLRTKLHDKRKEFCHHISKHQSHETWTGPVLTFHAVCIWITISLSLHSYILLCVWKYNLIHWTTIGQQTLFNGIIFWILTFIMFLERSQLTLLINVVITYILTAGIFFTSGSLLVSFSRVHFFTHCTSFTFKFLSLLLPSSPAYLYINSPVTFLLFFCFSLYSTSKKVEIVDLWKIARGILLTSIDLVYFS